MIKLLSDLHLEFKVPLRTMPYFQYDGEEVLVLAGDIEASAEKVIEVVKEFHDEGYPHIVYVTGNHEYYRSLGITDVNAKLRRFSEENADWFHFLDKDWYANKETKSIFIGATLWSKFGNNPLSEAAARRCIADFRSIPGFSTKQCAERYIQDVTYIKGAISTLHELFPDYKLYVVTHFLPAKVCIDPIYADDHSGLNDYFANNLDEYLYNDVPPGLTWLFGHTHSPCDFQHGNTRLICNPYGYYGYESQLRFRNKCYV